jgi:ABC-2 type transport system permease protein
MYRQSAAIVWAQWRTLLNYLPRANKGAFAFAAFMATAWYGMWVLGAFSVYAIISQPDAGSILTRFLPTGLFLAFVYWQVIPILMVTAGSSLDLKKLVVYPVPHHQLFTIELLLRVSVAMEMLIMLTGAGIGLLRNPALPVWSPLTLLPFVLCNLLFSTGIREMITRIFGRRRLREIAVIVLVIAAALPQLLLLTNLPDKLQRFRIRAPLPENFWPWSATANIALGHGHTMDFLVMAFWMAASYAFGRWQFEKGLRFDAEAAQATPVPRSSRAGWLQTVYRIPGRLFPDPLGALVEKEIRVLSRAPRFRLVFIMGFSFGLLIWLPITFGRDHNPDSVMASNYLTFISVYALMLLSEITIWNAFGFDRSATQAYFVLPVSFSTVLRSKNITALVFVLLETTVILGVCLLIRLPVTLLKVVEAYSVCFVFSLYLMAVGNLSSLHSPKPMNPSQSWRSSGAGKFQAMLLLIYPVLAVPVLLAYGARYAFENEGAFYSVLAIAGIIGVLVYWIAMESAIEASEQRKEAILTTLSQGSGPVA